MIMYELGDRVFAKMRGYIPWPSRISKINNKEKGQYEVFFYGTYDRAVVTSPNLFEYEKYKAIYGIPKARKNFNKALDEIENNPNVELSKPISSDNSSEIKHNQILKTKIESRTLKKRSQNTTKSKKRKHISEEDKEDDHSYTYATSHPPNKKKCGNSLGCEDGHEMAVESKTLGDFNILSGSIKSGQRYESKLTPRNPMGNILNCDRKCDSDGGIDSLLTIQPIKRECSSSADSDGSGEPFDKFSSTPMDEGLLEALLRKLQETNSVNDLVVEADHLKDIEQLQIWFYREIVVLLANKRLNELVEANEVNDEFFDIVKILKTHVSNFFMLVKNPNLVITTRNFQKSENNDVRESAEQLLNVYKSLLEIDESADFFTVYLDMAELLLQSGKHLSFYDKLLLTNFPKGVNED